MQTKITYLGNHPNKSKHTTTHSQSTTQPGRFDPKASRWLVPSWLWILDIGARSREELGTRARHSRFDEACASWILCARPATLVRRAEKVLARDELLAKQLRPRS